MEFPGYLGIPVMEFRVETIGLGFTGVLEKLGTGFSGYLGLRGMVRNGGFLAFSGSTRDDAVDTFIAVVIFGVDVLFISVAPPDLLLVICFDSLWLVCTFAFSL